MLFASELNYVFSSSQHHVGLVLFGGFKIYDATVAKTLLKIASSSLSVFFVIMPVSLTFESCQDNPGTEFRGAVSKLGKKIKINCGCVITFSVKLGKWSSHVADLPRAGKKYRNKKKLVKGVQSFCFILVN